MLNSICKCNEMTNDKLWILTSYCLFLFKIDIQLQLYAICFVSMHLNLI